MKGRFFMCEFKKYNLSSDKMLLTAVAVVLSLCCAFSVSHFAAAAGTVRRDVVRLHIIADCNTAEAQSVKLLVRDKLLEKNNEMLSGDVNTENVYAYFERNKAELLETAENVLRENGCSYGAKITLGKEYYNTRYYGDLVFPAGEYMSLRVVLGEGKGENWWCVMFPPLCIPAAGDVETDESKTADILTKSGEEIISSNGKYIVKFKLLELYEKLRENVNTQ